MPFIYSKTIIKLNCEWGMILFFSIETIDKINKENIKEIKLKNDTTYVSLPNPTILITTTSTPERQFSISVLDDDNKENLPTDTAPCFTIGIPDEYTKAIELLNIK